MVFPKPDELLREEDYIGPGLTARRESIGLSRWDLANLTGLSYNTIKRYETGQQAGISNFCKIENAMRAVVRKQNDWPVREGEVLVKKNPWPIPFELEYISEGLYYGPGLEARREAQRLTRRELANLAQIPVDTVRRYEYGKIKPAACHIIRLENAFRLASKYKW